MLIFRNSIRLTVPNRFWFATKPKRQKNFYQILEVPSNATPTTIKKNYIKLAKLYHPDVYKGADKNRFQKIQEAYEVLSNQKKRSSYDESIKVKSTWNQTTYDEGESAQTDGKNEYGKKTNEFRYAKPKVEIDIDEEYEKFFSKKSKTKFEQIRLHQQPEFKAMSHNQRIRRRFTQVYGDPKQDLKLRFGKNYGDILDDQIQQKNKHEKDHQKKKAEYEEKYSEEGIKRQQKYIKWGAGIVFLFMLPFIYSIKTKMRLEKEAQKAYQEKMAEVIQEMDKAEVRMRMKFE